MISNGTWEFSFLPPQSPSSSGEGRAELSLQKTSSSQGLLCFSSQLKNIRITIREISYLIRCRRESGNFLIEISFGDFLTRIESWVGERERERLVMQSSFKMTSEACFCSENHLLIFCIKNSTISALFACIKIITLISFWFSSHCVCNEN